MENPLLARYFGAILGIITIQAQKILSARVCLNYIYHSNGFEDTNFVNLSNTEPCTCTVFSCR